MPIDETFASEFISQLNSAAELSKPSTARFRDFSEWASEQLERSVATPTYVSSMAQYKARVGSALSGSTQVLVLLAVDTWEKPQRTGDPYVERLEREVRENADLEVVFACHGEEGDWRVQYIVGPSSSGLRRQLAEVFEAEDRPVVREARQRSTEPPPPPTEWGLDGLAKELHLPPESLREMEWLLRDKKALVLYGPPGTGKSYVAQKIAERIQPHDRMRRLVQLHPSYGYEEFFEGYRPLGDGEGISLTKRPGPLRVLTRNAIGWPGHPAVLVLDEMNRANLPRVFGELFFLLEYRDASVGLMYSPEEQFSLPEDFYLIGTMNTADRSVATLDQALRRRFHFFGMFPSEEPIPSMFRSFLQAKHPEMSWLAALLDRANALLGDRNIAIGPSHFMREKLDEDIARRVWKYSVIPTIRDQFFEDESQADDFDFDRLRAEGDGDGDDVAT